MLNKTIFKAMGLAIILILVSATSLLAQTTNYGKLSGVVTDKNTGEPIPGVAVRVVGTNIGAATGPDGSFTIIYLPAGSKDIEAVVIGYTSLRKEGVLIVPGLTTEVNFELTSAAVELREVITVKAERPLIERDATASTKIITADEIKQLPVRGFQQVTQLQAGVVRNDNRGTDQIQIRGGRPGEVNYFIDGFNTQDFVMGQVGANLNNNAIAEVVVLTGGFNAEYGQAMSGIVNTITKESGVKTSGQLEFRTDEFMGDKDRFGYNNLDFSLGGPLLNKKMRYFTSFEYQHRDDATPSSGWDGPKPDNYLKAYSGFGKLIFDLTPSMKLKLGGNYYWSEQKIFEILWRYNPNHFEREESKNQMYYITLTHNINKNTFYNISANYFYTKLEEGDDSLWDNYNDYINTITWGFPDTTAEGKDTLTWGPDSIYAYGPDGVYDYETPDGGDRDRSFGDNKRQDGSNLYYMPGVSRRVYSKRQSTYLGFNFDIVSQINPSHQVKSGFESRFYTARWFRIDLPWRANPFLDNYDKDYEIIYRDEQTGTSDTTISHGKPYKPVTIAFYVQDKMEFKDMVVNAGLRFDMLKAGADKFIDQYNVDSGFTDTPIDYKFSPRLGISFPVTENTLFHFNYGHFFQPPQLRYLYEGVSDALDYINTGNAIVGDPGLRAEKTIAYEVGITKSFSPTLRFDITAFTKDITDLVDTRLRTGLVQWVVYTNSDYARIRGVEFSLEKRRENYVAGKVSYTLSDAKGTGSYEREGYYDYVTSAVGASIVFPKTDYYLDFDQRHTISANIDIRARENEGVQPFTNAGINLLFSAGSGFPYTPRTPIAFNLQGLGKALAEVNSARQPWTYQLDLKADKSFKLGMFNTTLYLEVINLTDKENIITVYESSGKADDDRFLELGSPSDLFISRYSSGVKDPDNYNVPRMVRLGLTLGF